MLLETFQYFQDKGWSIKEFPDLDSEQTLILIFAAPEFIDNPAPIYELAEHYPKSKIIGCSSAGEISGPFVFDGSIAVAVVKFEKTQVRLTAAAIHSSDESYKVGEDIITQLSQKDLRGIFVLSEGLNINGSDLVKGLNTIERDDVVITGGLAGDSDKFKRTWMVYNGKIVTNMIVAVGLYGDYVCIGHGSRGGWNIFGPERLITRSKRNILYELDGKPALELYKEYLGEKASGLPATGLLFPLSIRKDADDTRLLVRTILAIDEKAQSLIFAGDIPMGYLAQLMRANFDRLINGAQEAGKLALANHPKFDKSHLPILLIAISCVGRKLLLGERIDEETETILEIFPPKTQQIGFYSYGELSPYTKGDCDLHNQTMTLTTISEEI